jgi:hypothetical protein
MVPTAFYIHRGIFTSEIQFGPLVHTGLYKGHCVQLPQTQQNVYSRQKNAKYMLNLEFQENLKNVYPKQKYR